MDSLTKRFVVAFAGVLLLAGVVAAQSASITQNGWTITTDKDSYQVFGGNDPLVVFTNVTNTQLIDKTGDVSQAFYPAKLNVKWADVSILANGQRDVVSCKKVVDKNNSFTNASTGKTDYIATWLDNCTTSKESYSFWSPLSADKVTNLVSGVSFPKQTTLQFKMTARVPAKSSGKFDVIAGAATLDPVWNASWSWKMNFSVNSGVSSTLTGFPAYFVFNSSALIAAGKMNASCYDVRIINSTEDGALPYEIENNTCNTQNTVVWFNTSSLASGNQQYYLYYGNPNAADAQNPANVWSDYLYVFHFGENSTKQFNSVGGNNATFTLSSGSAIMLNNNSAWIGGAVNTTGPAEMDIDAADTLFNKQHFYFYSRFFFGPFTDGANDWYMLGKEYYHNGHSFSVYGWHDGAKYTHRPETFYLYDTGGGQCNGAIYTPGASTPVINGNSWVVLQSQANATVTSIVLNNTEVTVANSGNYPPSGCFGESGYTTAGPGYIYGGAFTYNPAGWQYDEWRIATNKETVFTPARRNAEYLQTYSLGSEQANSNPDTTAPNYSNVAQNTSAPIYPVAVVKLSAYWQDDVGLGNYSLSTNETGAWANYSNVSFSGTANWSNVTWSNASLLPGTTVGWRIWVWDNSSNVNVTPISAFGITAPTPVVTLTTPADNSWKNANHFDLHYSVTGIELRGCQVWWNGTGFWAWSNMNATAVSNTSGNLIAMIAPNVFPQGATLWNINCSNVWNASAFAAANFTVRVDNESPVLTPVAPPNSALTSYYAFVNVSFVEPHNDTALIYLNGTAYSPTLYGANWFSYNFTTLTPQQTYWWFAWLNDSAGNSNYTANWTFTIDPAPENLSTPDVSITHGATAYHTSGWRVASNMSGCIYSDDYSGAWANDTWASIADPQFTYLGANVTGEYFSFTVPKAGRGAATLTMTYSFQFYCNSTDGALTASRVASATIIGTGVPISGGGAIVFIPTPTPNATTVPILLAAGVDQNDLMVKMTTFMNQTHLDIPNYVLITAMLALAAIAYGSKRRSR